MARAGWAQSQSGLERSPEATKAYMAAMDKMHGPMMQAGRIPIPTWPS